MKLTIYNLSGQNVGEFTLPKSIFEAKINPQLVAQAIRVYLNNQRTAHAVVKHRGEIAGTTKKMYPQKGTGQARHSTAKAPQFVGGGSAHGPRGDQFPRLSMSQKMRQAALRSLLSTFAKNKAIIVVDKLSPIEAKTKTGAAFIKKLGATDSSLAKCRKIALITNRSFDTVTRAFGNLTQVNLLSVKSLNTYQLSKHDCLLFTLASLHKLEKIL